MSLVVKRAPAQMAARLHRAIMRTNWGDTIALVNDLPFWEDIYIDLEKEALRSPELTRSKEWQTLDETLDVVLKCEDVRDFLNEIMEALDRKNPRGTTQFQPIENQDEHIQHILRTYEKLQAQHPAYLVKIDESVGKGVKSLRQRTKFAWPGQHLSYF